MFEYTVREYIESRTCLASKIDAIEALIDSMLLNAIDAIDTSGTASYSLDDGQMKISTQYRSIDEITVGIKGLEKIKQMYINRLNGNVTILRGKLN